MSIAIRAEHLSKEYRLGTINHGMLFRDIQSWMARKAGKPDPHEKIGASHYEDQPDRFWALKDVNFDIEQGDRVGIIGRNGAGKSTLLKILSRITAPTEGSVKIKGRVVSLLEVGTGFHPELTGRENIYLNGAILGMKKRQVAKKMDEIIDFSEIEKFIDTPVKRYSSGMYVRLAFAVAAHLDSDILLADEVLAVGDVAFQKKCLGKMEDVSKNQGRTVLFVSHNMAAVSELCATSIFLQQGRIDFQGAIFEGVRRYITSGGGELVEEWRGVAGNESLTLFHTWVKCASSAGLFDCRDDVEIGIEYRVDKTIPGLVAGFTLFSEYGYELAYVLYDDELPAPPTAVQPGIYVKRFRIPGNSLAQGQYRIEFDIGDHMKKRIINEEGALAFSLSNISGIGKRFLITGRGKSSLFRPASIQRISE